jgi:hypothetical protein
MNTRYLAPSTGTTKGPLREGQCRCMQLYIDIPASNVQQNISSLTYRVSQKGVRSTSCRLFEGHKCSRRGLPFVDCISGLSSQDKRTMGG